MWRYFWVARKPENATTANYDYHDDEMEEVILEADDSEGEEEKEEGEEEEEEKEEEENKEEKEEEEEEVSTGQVAGATRVQPASALVQPTADLTLNLPNATRDKKDSVTPEQSVILPEIPFCHSHAHNSHSQFRKTMPCVGQLLKRQSVPTATTKSQSAATAAANVETASLQHSSISLEDGTDDRSSIRSAARSTTARDADEGVKSGKAPFSGGLFGLLGGT